MHAEPGSEIDCDEPVSGTRTHDVNFRFAAGQGGIESTCHP